MKTFCIAISLIILCSLVGCQTKPQHPTYIVSHGFRGETDTTVIGYQVWDNGDSTIMRYYLDMNNYDKAIYAIQLSLIPFTALNQMAQKDYLENLKYIKDMKWLKQGKWADETWGKK